MLLFRLALQLGATVGELLGRMTSFEFSYWLAFYGLQPWGDERADLRSGIVAATVANCNRDPKQRPQPFSPLDFMPYSKEPAEEQTMEDQIAAAQMITEACRGE